MYVLIDFSGSMRQGDYKPNRMDFVIGQLTEFVKAFFDQNPISYLSLVAMRDGAAKYITRMNGQPAFQIRKLKEFSRTNVPSGTCSLLKALQLVGSPQDIPLYATRETLVIWGSLSSVDPPPFLNSISTEKEGRITVISMCPEVYAVKRSASEFNVALNSSDFKTRLDAMLAPKDTSTSATKPVYIKMGFPVRSFSKLSKCCCHSQLHSAVYTCPQCGAFVCEIPASCPACKLTLVDKEMLSRVHRLLYDMPSYVSCPPDTCAGCNGPTPGRSARCTACREIYCSQCSAFSHETLKHCIGCLTPSFSENEA